MADLSPAAQAVLDAYRSGHLSVNNLAAALRAAADQVLTATWEGAIQPDTTHMLGINWSRDALHAIAKDLEDQCQQFKFDASTAHANRSTSS